MKAMLCWFSGAIYLFLYAPIAIVIAYSFNTAAHGVAWQGFTFRWYGRVFQDPLALQALEKSLLLASTSTFIAVPLGTLLGYGMNRSASRIKAWLQWFLYIPVCMPDIVMAVSLLLFFSILHASTGFFQLGLPAMIIAHVTFQISFVALVIRARLAGVDARLEEAAKDLGATATQHFRHVTLPLLMPGIIVGAILAFTLSLDDFVVSFFTSGSGATTLPILIYASVKRGITPEINALSSLIIAASIILSISVAVIQRRRAATD